MLDYIKYIFTYGIGETFHVLDVLIILFGTFFLSLFIGFIYEKTYKGKKYNPGYVQTLIVLSIIVALIMLIVGSNIARAFTMLGAFSIIRFNNTIKYTRDLGFIFFSMAIGMVMGAQLYLLGVIGTLIISGIFIIMNKFDFFMGNFGSNKILEMQLGNNVRYAIKMENLFKKYGIEGKVLSLSNQNNEIISEETKKIEKKLNVVYEVFSKNDFDFQKFIDEIDKNIKPKYIKIKVD